MKKILSVLAILTLTFSLVACNNNKTNENNKPNNKIENVQNENTPNEEIDNNENEIEHTEFDENDFTTFYTIDEGGHEYAESLTIRLYESEAGASWYLADENDEEIVKVEDLGKQGNEHIYKFTGVSKGEKGLTFNYLKSQEDGNPERIITFVFDVNEKNQIVLAITGV